MMSFELEKDTEKKLIEIRTSLAEIYKELTDLDKEEAKYINHCALISNIGASTRIENAVLTDNEVEWLDSTLTKDSKTTAFDQNKEAILNKLSKDKERSIEEVAGCRELLLNIYANADFLYPLSQSNLRYLHKELLKHYPRAENYAGKYKRVTNRVVSRNQMTGEEKIVLEPAAPGAVNEAAMTELVDWYNSVIVEHEWTLLVAIEFVFRFLAIHPFQDGNGRLGRALFILALLQSPDKYFKVATKYMAIDRHIEFERPIYYTALRLCSEGKFLTDSSMYNYKPIVDFFLNIYRDSIKDIDFYRARYKKIKTLKEDELIVYGCFKSFPENRLSSSELAKESGLNLRRIQRLLNSLCDKELLNKLGQGPATRYQLVF